MKIREVLRVLHEDGWRVVAQRGSHRQLKHAIKVGRNAPAGLREDGVSVPVGRASAEILVLP